jgi:AhpD family alkylhydroperoxidase
MKTMQSRMKNPATIIPDAMQPMLVLHAATQKGGVPPKTLALVHLRASQINGCSYCIDGGARQAKKAGETDDPLFVVAAWRDAPYFSDAERAALASPRQSPGSATGLIGSPTRSGTRPPVTTTNRRLRP